MRPGQTRLSANAIHAAYLGAESARSLEAEGGRSYMAEARANLNTAASTRSNSFEDGFRLNEIRSHTNQIKLHMIACFFESPHGHIVGRFAYNDEERKWESVDETPDFDEELVKWQEFHFKSTFDRARVSVADIVPTGADMLFMWEM